MQSAATGSENEYVYPPFNGLDEIYGTCCDEVLIMDSGV